MAKKSAARAAKKAERLLAFEKNRPAFLAKVGVPDEPRLERLPELERLTPRVGVPPDQLVVPKQPKAAEDGGRFGYQMSWCIRRQDVEGSWSWGEPRAWSLDEFTTDIKPPLSSLENLYWQEIEQQSSDTGHRLHHQHELSDIAPEASKRWCDIGLEEFETLFRFRMGNTKRAWGVVIRGHFFMVWWERHHKIYPV